MNKIKTSSGTGQSQRCEGAGSAPPAYGKERQINHGNNIKTDSADRAPIHVGGADETEQFSAGEDMHLGDQGDHNFHSDIPAAHRDHYAHVRSEFEDGNGTILCDSDAGQDNQMQLEGGGEVSTAS
nr:hypothetical protein CFP56_20044 [Quercus suber]